MTKKKFVKMLAVDRLAAIRKLAVAVFDTHYAEDMRALWMYMHTGEVSWTAYADMCDAQLLDVARETFGWPAEPVTDSPEQSGRTEFPLIVRTPDVCGGSARLIRTYIPVWGIQRLRTMRMDHAAILNYYPTLTVGDLIQAYAYADAYKEEIDKEILENEDL